MDNMAIIAVASIVTAGFTTGIGCIGPALGEGRAVSTALSSLAQQPDASATITRTLFVGLAMMTADALSAKRQGSLATDVRNLNHALIRRTQDEVFAITRKTLADLASTSLEAQMSNVFTQRVRELNGKAKHLLAEALKTSDEPALVRTAFDLPTAQQSVIQTVLNETFSSDIRVRFETAPDLVSGIELSANSQKVAWSISDYLSSMEKGIGELLKTNENDEAAKNLK